MDIKFIPEILKDKILTFYKYVYGGCILLVAVLLSLSLLSFNIGDNSFLTSTNSPPKNLLGVMGSYVSSFIFYTFGVMGYFVAIFFFIYSILVLTGKNPKYIFIRLILFIISLLLIPQTLTYWKINITFTPEIELWGTFSNKIFFLHQIDYISYLLTVIGIIIFFNSQGILSIIGKSKVNLKNIFKGTDKPTINNQIKKEPIFRNDLSSNFETNDLKKDEDEHEINLPDTKKSSQEQYLSPSLDILESGNAAKNKGVIKKNIEENSILLEKVFADFNIAIEVINVKLGPVVTLFEILPSAGTKISTIINLAGDISRSMGVGAVRIAQIYGTQYLGVEVPNTQREVVTIKELLSNDNFKNTSHKIPICIGKDISGNIEVIDLSKTPHLLVAGTTGSGKSVFINTLLASILYRFSPKELRLILIDPKMLELSVYNDIAHLLTPVVTEPKKAIIALKWVCKEMERRYSLMNEENTRSLEGYNQKSVEKLPFIVVFIDEMADLMMTAGKEVEH